MSVSAHLEFKLEGGLGLMDLNMKVLIVDDFATMRRILRNILKQIGFTDIAEADDGHTALKELQKEKYDLILCDWNMPEMPGIDLLKTLKADENLKNIPFIMVTAEAQKENILEAVKTGVSSYIVKPFTAETVNEKLTKVFSG
jgi:two-component system chemotaxis response regulator CheY